MSPEHKGTTRLEDIPNEVLSQLLTSYLSLNDLRSLRRVSWSFRILVDSECTFRVTLNNSSVSWVKGCVPYIQEVKLDHLSKSKGSELAGWPDDLFSEVEELTFSPGVDESHLSTIFRVFPSVTELTLMGLSGKEIISVLQLTMDEASLTLVRNKVTGSPHLVTPKWSMLTKLKILMTKMGDSHGEVFDLLWKRHYPALRTLELEYRLPGHSKFSDFHYDNLHVVYVFWLQFLRRHSKSLRSLVLKQDFGADFEPQFTPSVPFDHLELADPESAESIALLQDLEQIDLQEITLRPHFQEHISNRAWNWNLTILRNQEHLVHLNLDLSDCWKSSDPSILRLILQRSKVTLKSLDYKSTSFKIIGRPVINFDLSMLSDCNRLEKLSVKWGWSRRNADWGPPLSFLNVEGLPCSLQELELATANGRFKMRDGDWISGHLVNLITLKLPTSMTKTLVTNLLGLTKLREFILSRDYFSGVKVGDMGKFCEQTAGLSYSCPAIPSYDPDGRWLDLLTITVKVDRAKFRLDQDLVKKYPAVLQQLHPE